MVVNNIKMVINDTLVAKQILLAIAKLVINTRIMVAIFLELVVLLVGNVCHYSF